MFLPEHTGETPHTSWLFTVAPTTYVFEDNIFIHASLACFITTTATLMWQVLALAIIHALL